MRVARFLAALLVAPLALLASQCGGTTAPLGNAPGDDVSQGEGGPPTAGEVPLQHRPQAIACAAHSGGGVPCSMDAECNTDTPGVTPNHCLQGRCSPDECTADADCAGGAVCSCDGATRGYAGASTGNVCVTSGCRVDADCGAGGYCSPTVSSACGSFYGVQGYYCHRAGDACMNDSDCPATGGPGPAPYCAYDPTLGRWACETGFCAG